MPHKLRKIRKTRGSRTQGYGRVGQHRDHGSKGCRKVGRHKHLWSYVTTYEPDYFGKYGFNSPRSLQRVERVINVHELEELSHRFTSNLDKHVIDLTRLGYTKLLGSGCIRTPLTVKVSCCTARAAEKVKNAGGQVITGTEEPGE
jgi:large subunit ribosomal protein L15